ncbi:hypothetical protein ACHHYP_03159 [Achlya hypogyna]|uniref:BAR domain-containing protein n=1 Tax=Achlya hypogyna TaxID=1202772 RepID=A0A1V9Z496_ACHHY|nr:hypothetical protein ACHHYP_03159 [Achlya hypogyna]
MSSIRVRATNKLLAKLGATKPSKNVQFEIAQSGFEQLASGVVSLDNALQGFVLSLKAFHASSNVLLRAIEDVSSVRCSDSPSGAPEVRQFIEVFKACSLNIDITKLTELVKQFETRVQKPSQGWLHQVGKLKTEVEDFNESHITFDHYTKKVQTLREAHSKRAGAGKQEKSKDIDKLMRNEQKLLTITSDYNKASETTIQDLRSFLTNRDATLLPLVQRIIEFRLSYAKEVLDLTAKMDPLLRISSYDEHLEQLEAFAPSGHGADGAPAPAPPRRPTAEVAVPDVEVKTLSFNDFVGSSPPPPSAPSADLLQASPPPPPPPAPVTNSWHDFGSSPAKPDGSFEPFASTPPVQAAARTSSGHITTTVSGCGSQSTVIFSDVPARTASGKAADFAFGTSTGQEFNPFAATPPNAFGSSTDTNPFAGAVASTPTPPMSTGAQPSTTQPGGFGNFDFMSQ